ncbi:uncharacterized protein LOC110723702 isoform X2 [Chenopodium quinoa]|nr:uncharacterized protein LOC110723702 isoform X2 [Chenopodium quinoa]
MSSVPIPATAKGVTLNNIAQSKAGSFSFSAPHNDAPKDPIDKDKDDTLVTLRDRKVRISDEASLYALCRSWLRNGYVKDNQPQYGDVSMSLPKPLPVPLRLYESSSPKRKDRDDEYESEVDEVEIPCAEVLLTRHIKRAKRIRARFREERSQRIDRYKSRLALLLPPNRNMQE